MKITVRNNSSTTGGFTPSLTQSEARIIIWSPRIDYAKCLTYLSGVDTVNELLDYSVITVYRDKTFKTAPAYITGATAGSVLPNSGAPFYQRTFTFKIKFPRKVSIGNTPVNPNGDLDEEKHGLFLHYVSGPLASTLAHEGKIYYFDA